MLCSNGRFGAPARIATPWRCSRCFVLTTLQALHSCSVNGPYGETRRIEHPSVSHQLLTHSGFADVDSPLSRSRNAGRRGGFLCSALPVPEFRRTQVAAQGKKLI